MLVCCGMQVQQTLKRGSAAKRALAHFFLAASGVYVRALRVVQVGVDSVSTNPGRGF
jgi:hypothetical protein